MRKRGRWRTDSSVRRYGKAAVAARQDHRLLAQALEYAGRVRRQLGDVFMGLVPAPVPPALAQAAPASTCA